MPLLPELDDVGVGATIQSNNLHDYFQEVISGDDLDISKPAIDCYLLTARHLGENPNECIAIEDSENEVIAAISAGIQCEAISTPLSKHHNLSGAIKVCSNIKEAKKWILNNYISNSCSLTSPSI